MADEPATSCISQLLHHSREPGASSSTQLQPTWASRRASELLMQL